MTTNNNTLKSGTPTKKTTLAGIRKQRRVKKGHNRQIRLYTRETANSL